MSETNDNSTPRTRARKQAAQAEEVPPNAEIYAHPGPVVTSALLYPVPGDGERSRVKLFAAGEWAGVLTLRHRDAKALMRQLGLELAIEGGPTHGA